jgi:glycosyltransferase involved in cell wall biosynthesis
VTRSRSIKRICILPKLSGVGGMVTFQAKLVSGLAARGVEFCYDLRDRPYDVILVVGGTRQLIGLFRASLRGIPIVQRLDGMNWLHRRLPTGYRHFLRAEYGNRLLAFIRKRLASAIVYQSEFVREWWERVYGTLSIPNRVVHNGIDLEQYNPSGPGSPPADQFRILLVEGTLAGGYEVGLEHALALASGVAEQGRQPVELMVVGRVAKQLRESVEKRSEISLNWVGLVAQERIPEIDRSAHVLYSADLNSACPNSVVEALACGLPVVSYDTGALPELVTEDAGRLAAYGGDPWKLDPPHSAGLVDAAFEVLNDQERFRVGARDRAERGLGLDQMVESYLSVLEEV